MFQPVGPPASSVRLGTGLCFRWHLQVCITVTPANCCPADSGSRSFTAPDCPSQARCPMDCWILSWSGRCGGPAAICWCQHLLRSRPRDSDSHCHVTVPLWLQLKTNFCWQPGQEQRPMDCRTGPECKCQQLKTLEEVWDLWVNLLIQTWKY